LFHPAELCYKKAIPFLIFFIARCPMMRNIRIFFIILLGLTAVYAATGFFAVPMILEKLLPQKLSAALNRPTTISRIHLNPFALSFSVEGFDMKDKNAADPFVFFDRLFVDIDGTTLIKLKLVIEEIILDKPHISLSRLSSQEYNISDLMPPAQTGETQPAQKQGPPIRFSLSNIRIRNGNITLKDVPKNKTHVFSPVNFTLPLISNFDHHIDTFATPSLEGSINDTGVSIQVETKPFKDSVETIVHLNLTGISLPYYAAYAPDNLGFKIADGFLDLQSQISYMRTDQKADLSFQGDATLSGLAVADTDDAPLFNVPKLKIKISPCHPLQRQVKIASVFVENAELNITRKADGKLNLLSLGPKSPPAEENAPPTEPATTTDAPKEPFQLEIDQIALGGCKIAFTDHALGSPGSLKDAPAPRMILDNLVLNVNGFSLAPETSIHFDVNARFNAESTMSASGQAMMDPFSVSGKFDIADIHLQWLAPYIPENIGLSVADGRFSTSGTAALKKNPDGKIAATIQADAAIDRFSTRDKASGATFASWDVLSLDNIHFSHNPLQIDIETVTLNKFNHLLAREKDGTLNVVKIFKSPDGSSNSEKEIREAEEKPAENKPEKVPVKIGKIQLKDFGVAFTDQNIEPHFSTRVLLSEARISGLTTEGVKAAKVFAKGKIDDYAPIEIKGEVTPLGDDLFLDMTLDLSNMELSSFSPYTGKYIGRAIEKGKLQMNISDRIENKNINGHLQMMLDQFTLGREVDSPDNLNLPVGLAVALLKDRGGKIHLDASATGRTDDPEFKPGALLWKTIKNIITKAATSPFDLVSSLVAGGEDLKFIEFEPGLALVDEENSKKIEAVATLMFERPGLNLDLMGFVDADKDRQALAEMLFDRKIKEMKYADLSKKERAATSIEDVAVTAEEYEEYLEDLYQAEVLSHPEKGAEAKKSGDETLSPEEMKSIIIGRIQIDDNQLRDLASRRTQTVKNDILKDGRVEASRLFIRQADALSPSKAGGHRANRVELGIK
jgi:uncharacterized protein involved in outer membrane biogenesis